MSNVKKSFGILVSLLLVLTFIPSVLSPPSVSAQDPFASELIGYSADLDGSGDYNNPQDVLGEPAKENPDGTRVSMVCPAWGNGKVTTINEDSYIVVKFDHHVGDDPDNPFGIDFIVFGNSGYAGEGWVEPGTNMDEYNVTGGASAEPVLVAVSQDGENWYNYTDGPYGDTEFPTNAYEWDRTNHQWSDLLDFTKPVDPSIASANFVGMSVADVIDTYYNGSAGGTGFDLAPSGFAWIQYIKVYGDANHKGGEIDAFADVSPVSVPEASVYVRVEGQNETIWSGNVTVSESTITDDESNPHYLSDPTALGALDEASQIGNFSYTVHYYEGLGLCIWSISGEGDWTNGPWWQYRVDDYPAGVGADSFVLNVTSPPDPPHHEILFYSSTTFSETPLKIALNKTEVDVGEEFAVTVDAYNDTTHNWSPCANATVHVDENYVTNSDGTVDVSISRDGSFKVFAEKSGYIRSDKVLVTVGTGKGTQAQVSLSANVVPVISIKISPLNIDFGNLVPGHTSDAHTLSVENKGGMPIKVTAQVTDQAQGLFVTGLKLDDSSWESFDTTVNVSDWEEMQAKLVVPLNYAGVGQKAGTLIFWAEGAS